MESIKIIIFEFLLGYVLQGFAIILGVLVFNKQKIVFKSYMIASCLVTIISCLIKLLPISYGVHTIINMLFLFLICIIVLKMPAYSTTRSALLVTMLLLVFELVNVAVMISILGKEQFESMMLIPSKRAYVGFPASILFAILMTLAYFITNKSKEKKGEINGNISK